MFRFNNNSLSICLPTPGVYVMGMQSATGKSYLCTQLDNYSSMLGESGSLYCVFKTFMDYRRFAEHYMDIENGSLVVLDRLDFFMRPEWRGIIRKRKDELYTLVDDKHVNCAVDYAHNVTITILKDKLEVMA